MHTESVRNGFYKLMGISAYFASTHCMPCILLIPVTKQQVTRVDNNSKIDNRLHNIVRVWCLDGNWVNINL